MPLIRSFCLNGLPMAWARPAQGRTKSGATVRIPDKGREAHKAQLAMAALDAWGQAEPFFGPVKMLVIGTWPIPAGWSAKLRAAAQAGEIFMDAKPDFDNIIKQVADALPFIAWVDDAQVADGRSIMRYGASPATECWISELEPDGLKTPATAAREKRWRSGKMDEAILKSIAGAARLPSVLDASRRKAERRLI